MNNQKILQIIYALMSIAFFTFLPLFKVEAFAVDTIPSNVLQGTKDLTSEYRALAITLFDDFDSLHTNTFDTLSSFYNRITGNVRRVSDGYGNVALVENTYSESGGGFFSPLAHFGSTIKEFYRPLFKRTKDIYIGIGHQTIDLSKNLTHLFEEKKIDHSSMNAATIAHGEVYVEGLITGVGVPTVQDISNGIDTTIEEMSSPIRTLRNGHLYIGQAWNNLGNGITSITNSMAEGTMAMASDVFMFAHYTATVIIEKPFEVAEQVKNVHSSQNLAFSFSAIIDFFKDLFGINTPVVYTTPSVPQNTSLSKVAPQVVVTQKIQSPAINIQNIQNIQNVSGVSKSELENSLASLRADILSIVPTRLVSTSQNDRIVERISTTVQNIQNLHNVIITDATASGSFTGTFSGDGSQLTGISGVTQWTTTGSNIYYSTGNVGIGTSSPYAKLAVGGNAVIDGSVTTSSFNATSTTATSTIAGSLSVAGNLNFNGSLLQNGVAFAGSQWTTSGSDIYYSTGKVGIGTTTPFARFAVNPVAGDANQFVIGSSTATSFIVNNAGRVGLGTSNAGTLLTLGTSAPVISVDTADGSDSRSLALTAGGGIGDNRGANIFLEGNEYSTSGFRGKLVLSAGNVNTSTGDGSIAFWTGASVDRMTITNGGNVGVGTTSPYAKFSVQGDGAFSGNITAGNVTATGTVQGGTLSDGALTISNSYINGVSRIFAVNNGFGFYAQGGALNKLALSDDYKFTWNSTGSFYGGADDLGINRDSAGVLRVNNGATSGFGTLIAGKIGIGTSSPYAALSVVGPVVAEYFNGTSTTATSTFGNVNVAGNLNFNGSLLQNGVAFAGSQWTTTGSDISYNTGNVGIGITVPTQLLHVKKDQNTNTMMLLENASAGANAQTNIRAINNLGGISQLGIYGGGNSGYGALVANGAYLYGSTPSLTLMADNATGIINFATGGNSEKMRISANGNLGIGTTSPFATLAVNPVAGAASNQFVVGSSTATSLIVNNTGYVGIGTSAPTSDLYVLGSSSNTNPTVTIRGNNTSGSHAILSLVTGGGAGAFSVDEGGGGYFGGTVNAPAFQLSASNGIYRQSYGSFDVIQPTLKWVNGSLVQDVGITRTGVSTLTLNDGSTGLGNINLGILNIGTTSTPMGRLNIQGTTTTTGKALSIKNSSGTETASITDNGAYYTSTGYFRAGSNYGIDLTAADLQLNMPNGSIYTVGGGFYPSDNLGSMPLGKSSNRWYQMFLGSAGLKIGNGTNGASISTNGTSPNENLLLTPGGTGSVSIGSTTPFATLSVNPIAGGASNQFVVGSSTATSFIINNAGNVGIGTTNPQMPLTFPITDTTIGNGFRPGSGTGGSLTIRAGEGNGAAAGNLYLGSGGVTNGGTVGKIFFGAGKNSGDATSGLNNTSMYLDASTGVVGIGNTSADTRLHVTNPTAQVVGTVYDVLKLTVWDGGSAKGSNVAFGLSRWENPGNNYPRTQMNINMTGRTTDDNTTPTTVMSIRDNGNVGIGTTSPYAKLSVTGSAVVDGTVTSSAFNATSTGYSIGGSSLISSNSSFDSIRLGYNTTVAGSTRSFALGDDVSVTSGFYNGWIGHGASGAGFTGNSQLVLNGDIYIGGGVVNSGVAGGAQAINAVGGNGSNLSAPALQLNGGKSTGNGTPGSLIFGTSDVLSSGSTLQSVTEKARIDGSTGNFGIGTTSPYSKLSVAGNSVVTGNMTLGTPQANNSLLTIFTSDSGSTNQGIVLSDKANLYGSWLNPSGQDGITVDTNGSPTGINGNLFFNYYSTGDVVLAHGGGNVLMGAGVSIPSAKLSIRGSTGSTTDLFKVSSSTNTVLFNITSNGNVGIGTTTTSATNQLSVQNTSGSTNVQTWYNTLGAPILTLSNAGTLSNTSGSSFTGSSITAGSGFTASNGASTFNNGATTQVALTLNGRTGQSGDMFRIKPNGSSITTVINAYGSMGVGSTTPYAKLSVVGTTTDSGVATTTFALVPVTGQTANILDLYNTSGALQSVITSGGNWGIGTTSPWKTLSVVGTIAVNGLSAAGGSDQNVCINTTTKEITFAASCGGSSIRWKKDVLDYSKGLEVVKALRPVSFKYKDVAGDHLGFIAEEVNLIEPGLIYYDEDGTTPRGIKYDEFAPIFTKAIQELDIRLTALETGSTTASSTSMWNSIGGSVVDGVLNLKNLVVEMFTAKKVKVTEGFEITDQATGSIYCVTIRNGEWDKVLGECGTPVATSTPGGGGSSAGTTTPPVVGATSTPVVTETTPSTPIVEAISVPVAPVVIETTPPSTDSGATPTP